MFTFLNNQVSDDREKVKWTRWLSVSTTFVQVSLVTLLELKLLSIAGFKKSIHIYICCNFLIAVQFSIMDSCDSSVIGIFSFPLSLSLNRLTITQFYAMHITAERERERGAHSLWHSIRAQLIKHTQRWQIAIDIPHVARSL